MEFHLEDDCIIELQGPWHSNAEALFNDTGVDIKDKHLTFVVIGKGLEGDLRNMKITDVVYKDEKPTVGDFCRGERLAMKLAKEMNMVLFCYSESDGGSSCGPVYPDQIDVYGKRTKDEK